MTEQLTLPLGTFVVPERAPDLTITERCEAFLAANSWVVPAIVELARRKVAAGHTRYGMKALIEELRWEYHRATEGDTYRLNNDYTAVLARIVAESHPSLAGLFEMRERRAA